MVKVSSQILYDSDFEVSDDLVFDENTFLFWPLNEGEGLVANDISGNNRNGNIYGDPNWSFDNWGSLINPEMITSNQYNIAGGLYYSMAVNSDRTLSGWGDYNSSADDISNVFSIARNYFGTGILYTDGTVGFIGGGEGNPQDVPENLNNVIMLVGGADHLLALKSDGSVVAWGKDDTGQATVPADLSGNIVGMSAGDNHSTVLFSDGTCQSWGNAGDCTGITDIRPVPEAIASGRGFTNYIKNYTYLLNGKASNPS